MCPDDDDFSRVPRYVVLVVGEVIDREPRTFIQPKRDKRFDGMFVLGYVQGSIKCIACGPQPVGNVGGSQIRGVKYAFI